MERKTDHRTIVGVDIGGTSTKIGLVQDGKVIALDRIPTTHFTDEHLFANTVAQCIEQLTVGMDLTAIGIGAPNANHFTQVIEKAPNLPWKNDVPLAQMVADRTGMRTVLGNDANAAALGEWKYGSGKGFDDLLVITLGTGVGSGVIVNGKLVLGSAGNAGEIGHTTIVMDGRECTCGRKGCLEAYVSIRGIRKTYDELDGSPELLKTEGVQQIAEAAENYNSEAIQTYKHTVRWLSVALVNAVAITGPGRIVLCGGIARSGALLLDPLKRRFAEDLLNIYKDRVDIVLSGLGDDEAGILGAAALITIT
ncbi:MAG: ROK family protein [Flavobacteriales bacterium]|nr:ROK family protein [Flavobacteriales bacterium]